MIEDVIGYIGGIFIMVSFVPQVIKSYKTRSVEDLSVMMILATLIGTVFWIVYGLMLEALPIILMNTIFGVIVLFQLFLKIKYNKKAFIR
ncbi:PQ-loop repeat-containing protein [Candidatus Woesearchaeota archaeon]|nr:PQ-loop repeat-containing protein [Candidatus Woesearchaeota archaeon]